MKIKFFESNKEPKLYNVIILTLITLLISVLLINVDNSGLIISIVLNCYYALCVLLFTDAVIKQIKYNPYSYNTIFYIGFGLFIFFVFLMSLVSTSYMLKYPGVYNTINLLYFMLNTASNYMIFTFPLLLIFSIALLISNISLLKHEGYSFTNILGVILAVLLLGGWIILYSYNYYATGSQFEVMMHDIISNLFTSIYIYFECMMIGTIITNLIVVRYKPEYNKDFVIVLGCGLRKDGSPTPLLQSRIDKALLFNQKQKELNNKELIFITSGGQGKNEVVSESEAMKNYLIENGIKEENIIMEDKSTNTLENMKYSKDKIDKINSNGNIIYSTNKYHLFRSGIHAFNVGMKAIGIGASTKWYFWPNASVREFVGLISKRRKTQAFILISMIIFYIALTIIVYSY